MMPTLGPFRKTHSVEQMTEVRKANVGIRGPLEDLEEQFLVPVHQGIIRSSWFRKYARRDSNPCFRLERAMS